METQVNKLDFTGQNIYVGMDTHKKSWKVSIVHDDVILKTFVQDPEPDLLYNYLIRNYPGASYHSAYEASYCGYWIHYSLKNLGINSIIVNAADIPTTHKEKVQKEDKRDSRKIAKNLRNGELAPIHIPSIKTLHDRTLVRTRFTIARELRRFKNRIKSFLLFYGIKFPKEFDNNNSHWSKRFLSWIDTISFENETATISLKTLILQVRNFRTVLLELTKQIRNLSKTASYANNVKFLVTVPGIGLITAMQLLTELEDICRFKTFDQMCAYIGFIPTTKSTGDKDVIGDITPRRHKALRTALVESSWVAIKNDPALLMKFTSLTKRMEANKAIIRIAKKLLNRIHYVVKNQTEYVKAVVK
jgi:transposase